MTLVDFVTILPVPQNLPMVILNETDENSSGAGILLY